MSLSRREYSSRYVYSLRFRSVAVDHGRLETAGKHGRTLSGVVRVACTCGVILVLLVLLITCKMGATPREKRYNTERSESLHIAESVHRADKMSSNLLIFIIIYAFDAAAVQEMSKSKREDRQSMDEGQHPQGCWSITSFVLRNYQQLVNHSN